MHAPNRTFLAALLASALAACSSDSFMPTTPAGPTEVSESSLNVITVSPTELPETTSVSFYAVKGDKREQRLYSERADGSRGDEYLRLTVDDNSLLAAPDGRPFLRGDSVLITILVAASYWAITVVAALLSVSLATPTAHHGVLIFAMLLVTLLLGV